MPAALRIHAFVIWPLFQAVRLIVLVFASIGQAVSPSCDCRWAERVRREWVDFHVEAWKLARQGRTPAVGTAVATEYATSVVGDWSGLAPAAARRVHCGTKPGGTDA